MISIDPAFIDQLAEAIIARLPKPEPTDLKLLVDGDQLATMLSISRPTVNRLVRDGKIPSTTIGSRRLFNPQRVLEAIQ